MNKNICFKIGISNFSNSSEAHLFEHLFLMRTKNFKERHSILSFLGNKKEEDFTFITYPESGVEITIRDLNENQIKTIEKEIDSWYFTEEDFLIEKRVFEIESHYVEKELKDNDSSCFNTVYVNSLDFEYVKEKFLNIKLVMSESSTEKDGLFKKIISLFFKLKDKEELNKVPSYKVLNFEKQELYLVVVLEPTNDTNISELERYFRNQLGSYQNNFEFQMRFSLGLVHNIKLKSEKGYLFIYFKTISKYHEDCIKEFKNYFV